MKRTPGELIMASEHLEYEIWMFDVLVNGLVSGLTSSGVLHNALLESFVIHVRLLTNFFYSSKQREDDVLAEDFFSSPEVWRNSRPPETTVLQKARNRAGKEVAHLTYARQLLTQDEKQWAFKPIHQDLLIVIREFLNKVPKEFLSEHLIVYCQPLIDG